MKVYINAEYPFILKKNGNLIKTTYDFAKTQASCTDVFEVCPLISAMPCTLVFNDDFITISDKRIIKVDLKGGYFIKLLPPEENGGFGVIFQNKILDALVTVYRDNGVKISIENKRDFIVFASAEDAEEPSVYAYNGKSFLLLRQGKSVKLFDVSEKIIKVLDGVADEWEFGEKLKATTRIKDMAKHALTVEYAFDGRSFTPQNSVLTCSPDFSPNGLPLKHLAYAFAEEVIAGGDVCPYLTSDLAKKADALKNYFGDAKGVFPAPEFKNHLNPMILYKRCENVYYVKYLSVEFQGRLISNLKLNDF